ncbi:MAG: hypothetical protein IKX40_03180 [Thermoguttaceae bacterium]|nr:hypothetical protein [Thermoguttaceae bacterium]
MSMPKEKKFSFGAMTNEIKCYVFNLNRCPGIENRLTRQPFKHRLGQTDD